MTDAIETRDPEAIRAHKAKGGKVELQNGDGSWAACKTAHVHLVDDLYLHRLLPLDPPEPPAPQDDEPRRISREDIARARKALNLPALTDDEWVARVAEHRRLFGDAWVQQRRPTPADMPWLPAMNPLAEHWTIALVFPPLPVPAPVLPPGVTLLDTEGAQHG